MTRQSPRGTRNRRGQYLFVISVLIKIHHVIEKTFDATTLCAKCESHAWGLVYKQDMLSQQT